MLEVKSELFRLNTIIKLIQKNQDKGITTLSFLLEKLNEHIENNNDSKVTQRTLERDIKKLREGYVNIEVQRVGKNSIYVINGNSDFLGEFLNEEEQRTLPFLLEIIQSQHEFEAITWLKANLHHLGIEFSDRGEKHFIMHQPEMKNHDRILRLGSQLIEHVERQEAVQFLYNPVNSSKEQKMQIVAPLQVRCYDGRFYLVGCYWGSKGPYENITVYALDRIEGLDLNAAVDEEEYERKLEEFEDSNENPVLRFNYKKLAKAAGLRNYFDHSIGVVVDSRKKPQDIYFKCRDWVVGYLENRPLHRSQRVLEVLPHQIALRKDEIVIGIHVYDTVEVEFATARFRNDCVRLELKKGVFEKYVKPKEVKKKK